MNGLQRKTLLGAVFPLGALGCGRPAQEEGALRGARQQLSSGVDFTITSVTGPTSVVKGTTFLATFTLCNQGQLTDTTDVELYFSEDTTIRAPAPGQPPEDHYLGSVSSLTLAPGACTTQTVTLSAHVPAPASYYLGAVADPYHSRLELFEDNNARAGTRISVIH